MKKTVFILFLFCSIVGLSQTDETKKLIEEIITQKNDSNKVNKLNTIAYNFRENDNIQALQYGKKALELGEKLNFVNGIWYAMNNIGEAERYLGKTEAAILSHQKALDFAIKHSVLIFKAHSLNNLAILLKNTGNLEKAKEYYMLALEAYIKVGSEKGYYTIYNNLGNMFSRQGNYLEAYRMSLKAHAVALDMKNSPDYLCQSLDNLGNRLWELNKKDSCKILYQQAYELSLKYASKREIVSSGSNLAYMYYEAKEYERAEKLYNEMLEIAKQASDKYQVSLIYGFLDEMYYATGKYKLAHDYQDSVKRIDKEILSTENIKSINNLTASYENEKKELQISNLSKENEVKEEKIKRENIFKIVFAVGFVLIGVFAIFLFRSLREKEKARKIIDEQKKIVEAKQAEILDSIQYAKRIQNALLPSDKYFSRHIGNKKN